MTMKYKIFYHTVDKSCDYDSFLSAGIIVQNDIGVEIKRIYDVSTDFKAIENLILSLNTDNVELDQLYFILENYYSQHF